MGFRNLSVESLKTKEDIGKLASSYGITNQSAIKFMQGVHDGNIVLKDGQTMLQGYQAYLASTSQGLTLANLKTQALSVSMKLLSNIGWTALITGISWLASKGIEALDKIINREKYLKKAVEESASAYDSVKSQVESLNSELETTKSRIDELNAKDSLTFIEQEELDKLKDATAELKAQLLLMEEEEQKKKTQYLEDQAKLYNEKYKDEFDPASPKLAFVQSSLEKGSYNIKDLIEVINLLNELNGTMDESGYVYDFTDAIAYATSDVIENKKSEYEEYKAYLLEFLNDLYEELGDEAFGTEIYQTAKQDLIQAAQLFGDNVTLSNYMFTDDQMQDVKDQIINYFTNGGTIDGVSEAIGDSLYQSFSAACNKLGIPISEMLNNMYAEATDNLDPVGLQNKMLQSFQDIAIANDVEEEYVSIQKELQEYTRDFTNTQKQLWIEATNGATSATEAVQLYKQALYGNDRNSYISDHLTNLISPTKQDGEFYNFINSLDDEDYQIVLKLDVDASTPIEQIQEQIRNSKEEFSDIFSAIFSGTGDDAVTFEDALGNTKDTIDEIKGYLDDLYENGIKDLSSEAMSSIEKLAPGFSSALSNAEDKTSAAIEYLTQLLGKQDDEIVKFLDNLLALENLSDSTVAYIENLKATLQDETTYTRDLGGLLAEYQTGAKLDDLFYAFQDGKAKSYRDAIDDTNSRISSLTDAYDKLWEYQLKIGEASNDIDSAEFTKFITDLIREFPELAQYTDGTTDSIEGLREAIARLCETEPNEIISALQELSDSADLTEEMRNQIDLLIDSLSNLSTIDMSMDTTKNVISDMCTEMDNLVDLMDLINNTGLKIDVSDAQKYLELWPELLENAVPAGDGMIQLNEDVVNSFIEGKKAEIEADGEARIQELQNANAVLESKIAYEQAKIQIAQQALNTVSTMDDAEAVNKINNLQDTLDASIQAGNDELTAYDLATQAMMGDSDALNLLNKTASEETSANWASSFLQSDVNSGKASYAIQKNLEYIINMANGVANALRNMITGKTTGSPGVRTTSGGGYSGSTGKTSTSSSGNTKSGGMLSNILGAIGGNLGNFINSVKGSVKNVVDTTLNNISGVFGKLNANLSNSNSSLQLIDIINTANANIEDYKNAIASNNQQIAMIKAFGAGDIDKYVAKKLADKNAGTSGSKGSKGSKGSGGKGGDGGSSANETKETFNWIEVAIERIETAISRLNKAASNTYNQFSARNEALVSQLENVRKEIDLQQQAYVYYLTQAESVGLSESWKNKVKNGEINIDSLSDENLINQIKSYQEWYEKVIQCQDALIELDQTVSDLYKESFDLISSTFDSILSDFENRANLIEGAISQTEERGYLVGKSFYEELTKFENQNIDTLNKERTDLLNKFSEAVNSGAIREGSEEWYNMKSQIDEVTQSIQEATTKTIEYANAVRDIDWERFDLLQDKISKITDESNFLIDLMSNSDLFDDKGKITDYGISTMGLHGMNLNTYMEQADQYRDEMLRINDEIANDPNNQTLIDRKQELLELQQESIKAAEEEKQAIKDLVKEGIEKELSALKNLVDEYINALDSQKDLHEYQKNIADQTTEISKLQKQIASLANDDSEENRAKLQELNESLKEAKENLEETQYDQFISDQKKLLDEMQIEYESILNERLDNLDLLIQQCVDTINLNSETISATLTEVSDKVGYDITNKIDEVFSSNGEFGTSITSAIGTYNDNFSSTMTGIQSVIQGIATHVAEMAKAAEEEAAKKAEELKKQTEESAVKKESTPSNGTAGTGTSGNSGNSGSSGNTSGGDGVPRVGDVVTYTGSYMYSSYGRNPAGNLYSGVQNAVEIYQINNAKGATNPYRIKYVKGGDLGWVSLSQLKGYKTGKKSIEEDQLAWTQENGEELLVVPNGSMILPDVQSPYRRMLTDLQSGTMILDHQATENFWDFMHNPDKMMEEMGANRTMNASTRNYSNMNTGNITNDINMSITLPGVTNYDDFVTRMQHDPKIEKMFGYMSDARMLGTSRYKKYSVNFGK